MGQLILALYLPKRSPLQNRIMKKNLKFLSRFIFIGILFLASCSEEDGILPDADTREKFVGTWNVAEQVNQVSNPGYTSVVSIDTANTSKIVIKNVYNLGSSVSIKALVAGNSLSIDQQDASGILIQGNGSFSNSSFVLNLSVNEGDGPLSVTATYTR
jgi:hypothetical protein